mgnify:CR=1 FL=1
MNIISQTEIEGRRGTVRKTHVHHSGKYYVISENPQETLIFPSDSEGKHSYLEVGSALHTSEALLKIQNGQIMS